MPRPERRPNRLPEYDYSSNGVYFITICVKNRAKLLSEIVGGGALDAPEVRLTAIGKIAEKYILSSNNIKRLSVENYVIMPDHIHMLIYIDNIDGSSKAPTPTNSILSHMVGTFKRFCNREIGRNIWQRSFYDRVIRNEEDYKKHYMYIEGNPAVFGDTVNGPV